MKSRTVMNIQTRVYALLPLALRRLADLRFVPGYLSWRMYPDGYKHTYHILAPLCNTFVGCRCIIMGNGPSLRQMDLSVLKDEYTFGLNRIYLLYEELGFETTFLVAVNRLVLDQFAKDISKQDVLKFLSWAYRGPYDPDSKTAFLALKPGKRMDGQALKGYCGAGTVTNTAIEIAYFMGFSEVILIGVDHSYAERGTPGLTIVSGGADQNHFHPDYFGRGIAWQLPDYEASERGYREARELFESNGRKIVDATKGGKLQVFDKRDFEECLANSSFMNRTQFEGPQQLKKIQGAIPHE